MFIACHAVDSHLAEEATDRVTVACIVNEVIVDRITANMAHLIHLRHQCQRGRLPSEARALAWASPMIATPRVLHDKVRVITSHRHRHQWAPRPQPHITIDDRLGAISIIVTVVVNALQARAVVVAQGRALVRQLRVILSTSARNISKR